MYRRAVRLTLWLVLVALLVTTPAVAAFPAPAPPVSPPAADLAPFDPYILEVIDAQGQAPFFVVLKLQADLSSAAALPTKQAKGRYVYDALTEVAAKTQGAILRTLKTEGASYKPYWIRNMVRVRGDRRLLREMAARPDVAEILYEYPAVLEEQDVTPGARTDTVEWNIERVHAPDVWALGITGEGAVVGDLDTGVQWDHPALKKHYRGCQDLECTTADHNYNWWDTSAGSPVPIDYGDPGHGTHTMGTIIGDDGSGNQIGVAPGAKWMACAGDAVPNGSQMECFQWFLAPTRLDGTDPRPDLAPDVINNSWTADTDFRDIIKTLYAAGIFYAKSGGNTGPQCGTTTNPGQWPEVTAAAAFDAHDVIASFSSRGPITIGHDTVLKPDVAAPGVDVRSSLPTDDYGLLSGTSMACPHTTGAVALLISARPDLAGQIDILQKILKETAEPVVDAQCPPYVDHPNDVWGWGILDDYAAVLDAQSIALGDIQGTVYDGIKNVPLDGAQITFQDASGWEFLGQTASDGSYGRMLPAGAYQVTTSVYAYLPAVDPGVIVSEGAPTTHDVYLAPAPVWTVSGQVTESQTGSPLAATITFEGTDQWADTNPATGLYSIQIPEGAYWMDVSSPGHTAQSLQVMVDADRTEDFSLEAIYNYPMRSSHDMCSPPAFAWMDASGGTKRCLGDDSSLFVSLPSGHPFTFYGASYTSIFVSANGLITFGASSSKWSGPIPNPSPPNNGIYAFSTNLNPGSNCSQGTVYTAFLDSRYFVTEWYQVEHSTSGDPETFEIILDLDTGQAVVQLLAVSNPSGVVVGVENSTGTEATQYAYDDPVLIADNTRVEFTPVFGTPPAQGPGKVWGPVIDEITHLPIEEATVQAVDSGGGVFTATTGPGGTYELLLCPDSYTLSATADEYLPSDEVVLDVGPAATTLQGFVLLPVKHHRLYLPVVRRNYP